MLTPQEGPENEWDLKSANQWNRPMLIKVEIDGKFLSPSCFGPYLASILLTFQACLKAKFSIVFRNRAEDIQSIHNLPKL